MKNKINKTIFVFFLLLLTVSSNIFAQTDSQITRAQEYIEKNDYKSALMMLNSIPEKKQTDAITNKKIECYIKLNMVLQAVEAIQKLCFTNIYNFSYSKNEWGDFLRKNGYKSLAHTLANQLYEKSKEDNNFWYWSWYPLFTSYVFDNNNEKIYKLFTDIIDFEPSSAQYYVEYLLTNSKDYQKAEKILTQALENAKSKVKLSPKILFWTYKNLTEFLRNRGDSKKLRSILKELRTNFQSDDHYVNMEVYMYVGEMFKAYSHFEEALNTFKHALSILNTGKYSADPTFVNKTLISLANSICDTYVNQGKPEEAIEFLNYQVRDALEDELKIDYYISMLEILFYSYLKPDIEIIMTTIKNIIMLSPKEDQATKVMEYIISISKDIEDKESISQMLNQLSKSCDEKGAIAYAKYLSSIDKGKKAMEIIEAYRNNTKSPKIAELLSSIALEISAENRFFNEFEGIKNELEESNTFKTDKLIAELNETIFNKYDESFKYYEKAASRQSLKEEDKVEMILGMARSLFKKGNINEADELINKKILEDESLKTPHIYASIFYRTVPKNYDKSVEILEKGLNLAANSKQKVEFLLEIARTYRVRMDPKPKKAIEIYNEALNLSDDSSIYEGLYLVYSNLMSDRETEYNYLDILLNRDPTNSLYKIWHANFLAKSDNKEEALKVFHSIPGKNRGLYNTACLWLTLGDKQKALLLLEKDMKAYAKKGKFERNERKLWMATDQTLQILRTDTFFQTLVQLEP